MLLPCKAPGTYVTGHTQLGPWPACSNRQPSSSAGSRRRPSATLRPPSKATSHSRELLLASTSLLLPSPWASFSHGPSSRRARRALSPPSPGPGARHHAATERAAASNGDNASSTGSSPGSPPVQPASLAGAGAGQGPATSPSAIQGSPVGSPAAAAAAAGPARGSRQTLGQMQKDARATLGALVQQQMEAEQRARQQQQLQQQQPQQRQQQQEQRQAAEEAVGPAAASAARNEVGTVQPSGASSVGAAGGAAAAPASAAAAGTITASGAHRDRSSETTANRQGGGSSSVTGSRGGLDPDEAEWRATQAELDEDLRTVGEAWRQFLRRPLDPLPELPSVRRAREQRLREQQQQQEAQYQGQGPEPQGGGVEVVVPQVLGPDGRPVVQAADQATAGAGAGARFVERTFVTRVLQVGMVAAFVWQWWPVAQALAAGGAGAAAAGAGAAVPVRDVVLGLLLACPPTAVTMQWQADAFAVASGEWGCLLTSGLLHSGLLSLGASLAALDETGPWLETLSPLILLLCFGLSALGTGMAQLWFGGQAAGIGGLGAVLGLEAATAVRMRLLTGRTMPVTPAALLLAAAGALMAWYQPLVGPWGLLGGLLGGALAGLAVFQLLYVLRVVLALVILAGVAAWTVLTWVPRMLWRAVVVVAALVWGAVEAVVQGIRGL